MGKSRHLKTPKRAFETLEALAEMEVAAFSELADRLEYPNSTLHDYVRTLKEMGYIVEENGKLRVSTRFLGLGKKGQRAIPLYEIAKPRVDELADQTGEHASFVVEENGQCVVAYLAKGSEAVDFGLYTGMQIPLSTTATGKAILAQYPEEQVHQILDSTDDEFDVDRERLFEELATITEQGFARDEEERLNGIRAIASPIVCGGKVRGALAVGGAAIRMNGKRYEEEIPNVIRKASNEIEIEATHAHPIYSSK